MAEDVLPGWKRWIEESGDQIIFLKRFFRNMFRSGFEWSEFIRQCYEVGYKSFALVGITAFIMGLVLALQLRPTLVAFGAESTLPRTLAISIVREIGPVITAVICAGKIASGIGAELGSMKVTEQIDAMDVSGANPMQYLVVTRILATTVMVPVLTLLGDVISLFGGFVAINIAAKITSLLYFNKCIASIEFSDFFPAIIKSILFGFTIGFIGCYKGYNSQKATESVGISANSAVVAASLWIFVIDAIAAQICNILFYQ
jgi:phospholipid/cholesterol/gamma-HCH transport system permease protein